MQTEITGNKETRGWIFYDADCSMCARSAARSARLMESRGFALLPLQTPGAAERLQIAKEDLLIEMRLLTSTGKRIAGADAIIEIVRHFWWAWPFTILARIPGAMLFLRWLYARLAANRHCSSGACMVHRARKTKRVFFEMP